LTTKQRQQKLFSSLINRDQDSRSYNYKESRLIPQNDNILKESNYSSYNTNPEQSKYNTQSKKLIFVISLKYNILNRYYELEADLDLYEKRNKLVRTMENFGTNKVCFFIDFK